MNYSGLFFALFPLLFGVGKLLFVKFFHNKEEEEFETGDNPFMDEPDLVHDNFQDVASSVIFIVLGIVLTIWWFIREFTV